MGTSPLAYFIRNFTLLGLISLILTGSLSWNTDTASFTVLISGVIFTWLMTLVSGLVVGYTFTKAHKFFMIALVGGMLAKLLVSPLYIYVMAQLFPDSLLISTMAFLFFYLLFTGFEVYQFIRNLRPHLKKDQEN
jgi:hypothetical protein